MAAPGEGDAAGGAEATVGTADAAGASPTGDTVGGVAVVAAAPPARAAVDGVATEGAADLAADTAPIRAGDG